jgi:hypothetical protein
MNLPEVQSEPEALTTTIAPPSVEAPGRGAGRVVALPRPAAPRPFYGGHRIITLASGQDWCVACGPEPRPDVECLPDLRRCESCQQSPGLINDQGFYVCGSCHNGGARW